MPPKGKKASAADQGIETEEPFQAVVLADSFETRFNPFTKDKPRCLLPLASVPLIEYTLEFLANSGVEEVYIYCGAHTEQLEAYISNSRWARADCSPFTIETIRSASRSIGDAMRDLDKRGVLKNDFLMVYGDVITNISIEPALLQHRARKAADKNAIMTMVLREANVDIYKGVGVSPVFIMDPAKQRCLQYEQIRGPGMGGDHAILIDTDVLLHSQADEILIRHDLIDCGVDICTPDVLALWSDNFDYEAPRRGYLHSVLKDYELNGKTIHTFIEKEGYADRVRDLMTYNRITKDILARKTFPLTPDCAFSDYHAHFQIGVRPRGVLPGIDESAFIGKRSTLGNKSTVGARSQISGSVIGSKCTIGEDCVIEGAYLWDSVKVGDRTRITNSIVASDVSVGSDCNIQDGTLISYGATLTDKTTTEPDERLVRAGKGTSGFVVFQSHADSESDAEDSAGMRPRKSASRRSSVSSISTLTSSRSASPDPQERQRTMSMTSIGSDAEAHGADAIFHSEAKPSIYDSLLKGYDPANINLELQAQRLALNASEHAVRKAVVSALVDYIMHVREEQRAGNGQGRKVSDILQHKGDLIRRVIFDTKLEAKTDQVDLLLLMQRELSDKADGEIVMLSLCNGLYQEDLVQDEALVQWWEDSRGSEGEAMRQAKSHKQMAQLIEIARGGSDSEEEEEEDEDDEDDEEDDDED